MSRGFRILTGYEDVAEIPQRETYKSAGYDIKSCAVAVIEPGTMQLIATGLTAYMEDYEQLELRARSGLAFKKQITLQNGVGTIDSDYEGQHIGVLLRNEGTEPFVVNIGDRICQGVFTTYEVTDDDHPRTERTGGFGSTGV